MGEILGKKVYCVLYLFKWVGTGHNELRCNASMRPHGVSRVSFIKPSTPPPGGVCACRSLFIDPRFMVNCTEGGCSTHLALFPDFLVITMNRNLCVFSYSYDNISGVHRSL